MHAPTTRPAVSGIRLLLMPTLVLFTAGTVSAGPVTLRQEKDAAILGNGLAEYRFRPAAGYDLCGVRLGESPENLGVTGAHLVYCEEGIWKRECGAAPGAEGDAGFADHVLRTTGDAHRLTLQVTAQNDRLRLEKRFTLSESDPALEIAYRVEATARNGITWGYPVLMWLDDRAKTWIHPENVVRGGRVVEEVRVGPIRRFQVGNQPISLEPETWVGCCDAAGKGGILAINGPGTLLRFRAGEQGKQGFLGLVFHNFSPGDPAKKTLPFLTASFSLVPFSGEPEAAVRAALARLGSRAPTSRLPQKALTGRRIPSSQGVSVWTDLATAKVFRDEPVPTASAAEVAVQAARAEGESFQIVLRPESALEAVRLELTEMKGSRGRIAAENLAWHPLDYYRSEEALDTSGFAGEVPDALLPDAPLACPAGRAQPFWVTVRVPADTPAGEYRGIVRVLSGERVLAQVPVKLQVWGFTLPQERSLLAFDPLWKNHLDKHYGRETADRLWPAYLDDLAAHRVGMLHPEASAVAKWGEDGSLASADFGAFDRAMEEFFGRFHLRRVVLGDFTVGYGHEPRDNRFGRAAEILSPLWRARCEGYARALAEHLRVKGWSDRVVFSLFDEPDPKYYPLIRDTVALLHRVEPGWRFTFWGAYAPALEGAIQVWTVPASYYSPSTAARARARGEEVWVYNPPGYRVDATAMAVRANYWWLWRERIPAVFQWTSNAWIEWTGSTTLWDAHREASWVLPGPNGPVDTLRLELTREGMEDYEYLALADRLCAEAERRGLRSPAAAGRKALADAERIAGSPESEQIALLHTEDQALLHRVRSGLGDAIQALTRALPGEDEGGGKKKDG